MKYIKPREYSNRTGISYKQVINMFYAGEIRGFQTKTKSIYLEDPDFKEIEHEAIDKNRAIIYARVSSSDNKKSLDGQVERCQSFAIAKGLTIIDFKKEVASGLNEDRRMLWQILNRNDFDYLIVEHKDRLTRFGFKFIEELCKSKGIKLLVINETFSKSPDEELMNDFVSIVTSFCSRIYGRKRKRRTERIIDAIKDSN